MLRWPIARLALLVLPCSIASLLLGAVPATSPTLPTIEFASRFDFPDDPGNPALGLSGITYAGHDDLYYAVSDATPKLFPLTIHLEPTSARIGAATLAPAIRLTDQHGAPFTARTDDEGCAFEPATGTLWISDEGTDLQKHPPQFRQHDPATGRALREAVTPYTDRLLRPFANVRGNLSFESLSRSPVDGTYWSANEESLTIDAAASTQDHGSVIRLIHFDHDFKCMAQYPYLTDAAPPPSAGRFDRSGVSDVCVLPDGSLLVLERAVSLGGYRTRIYLADTAKATDLSKMPYLTGLATKPPLGFTPARKTLLFEQSNLIISTSNYEGLCVGPKLPDGSYALFLIADNNNTKQQSVQSLRLHLPATQPARD